MDFTKLAQRLEGVAVWIAFHALRWLSIDAASALGGWVGRTIGPRLRVTRRAYANLRRAFPDWPQSRLDETVGGMWENLGRTAGEYSQVDRFDYGPGRRVEIEGLEHLRVLGEDGEPGIFFSAHLGNWELAGLTAARHEVPITLIYRAANNPFVDWVFSRGRQIDGITTIAKGASGARQALSVLKRGGHLGMLVDQKLNDGIAVPFFGRPAMTAPALAVLALKFACPVLPARVTRLDGARFRITFEPPLALPRSGDHKADVLQVMTQVNATIERWVRERPEQWLWVHRRWPD